MAVSSGPWTGPILEIDRVSKRFGPVCAVDDVSIAVRRGEFLTFLGPSGCGKTTLLRMVAGFESETAGEIRIAGQPMTRVKPFNRPVGIVFQNLALFPHLSVNENVGFGLAARRTPAAETRSKVAEALAVVELAGFGDRRIHEMSGGQRQRVALARALILQPAVLLLDEPLSALDLKLRRQLQYELKAIQQRVGTTFLFVTHDQEEALTMSDRIAVINRGKLEQLDTPEAIYQRPASSFVAQFVGDTNLLQGTVAETGDSWSVLNLSAFGMPARLPFALTAGVGAPLALSVRPEHVRLGADANGCAFRVTGVVADRSYIGAHTRYVLTVPGGSDVIATQSSLPGGGGHRVGDQVPLGFDLAHAAPVSPSGERASAASPSPGSPVRSGPDSTRPSGAFSST